MKVRRSAIALCGVLLLASLVPISRANAQDRNVITVQSGASLGRKIPAFSARMFAPVVDRTPTIQVHHADIVHIKGFMLLLPAGMEPATWREQTATGLDSPYGVFSSDPDPDLPGVNAPTKANLLAFGEPQSCGTSVEDACFFDGSDQDPVTGVLNPSDTVDEFFIDITADPGTVIWATPLFTSNQPTTLKIEVVEEGAPTTTQAEVDAAKSSLRSQDRADARELMQTLSRVDRERQGNHWVYQAYAGYDTDVLAFLTMFPKKLTVRKGDVVEWNLASLNLEPHTATFPFKKALNVANSSFVPACDPDGDDGTGQDVEGDFSSEVPQCPEGAEVELDLTRQFTAEIGDGAFPGGPRRYESSGLRGSWVPSAPGLAGGIDPWSLRFTKASSDKGYKYLCLLHGRFMSGKVVVK